MRARILRAALTVAALGWLPFALAIWFDLDLRWQVPAAVAFLPYALAATLLVAALSLAARAWLAVAVAAAGLLLLAAPRADRALADPQPQARGQQIVVATSNVYVGNGDLPALARLVRRERVDVLAVQENTPESDRELRAALGSQLEAHRSTPDPRPGAAGLALLAGGTITPDDRLTAAEDRALGGTVTTRSGAQLTAFSVHPPPPFSAGNLPGWKRYQRAYGTLLDPAAGAPPLVLLGDFNATLDHHPLRALLDAGFRDAAEQAGQAWRPTWEQRAKRLTIDHVLVGPGIAVEGVAVHPLAGTDHHVVVARLRLPAS